MRALAQPESDVRIVSPGVPALVTRLPVEFDGPGDAWSPETLFVAAVADCYAMTFRGIARRSNLSWLSLECEVDGTLDRVNGVTRFTELHLRVRVQVREPGATHIATRVMLKAEETCLITRSLNAAIFVTTAVETTAEAA